MAMRNEYLFGLSVAHDLIADMALERDRRGQREQGAALACAANAILDLIHRHAPADGSAILSPSRQH